MNRNKIYGRVNPQKSEQIRARIEKTQYGFVSRADLREIVAFDRLRLLLVRCGGFRALVPANQVESFTRCIEAGGDYVRDISYPAT
jgi:hypothetical protein